ncbi:hypothetical protein ALP75_202660 [Pseudomonas syringae pv. actinidiae]|nr:hypothetical protein ALP75_202660 [Pseudomonas syringae pv. actinidiae]
MFTAIRTSTSPVGSGVIIMNTMAITKNAPTTSERRMADKATMFRKLMIWFIRRGPRRAAFVPEW